MRLAVQESKTSEEGGVSTVESWVWAHGIPSKFHMTLTVRISPHTREVLFWTDHYYNILGKVFKPFFSSL